MTDVNHSEERPQPHDAAVQSPTTRDRKNERARAPNDLSTPLGRLAEALGEADEIDLGCWSPRLA